MKSLIPQRLSRSLLSLLTCGYSPENCRRIPSQLNVVRAHHIRLSDPLRLSESRKPGSIWLKQVLGQLDILAERSRDHNRAGSFAVAEGWEDRQRDRNAGELTSVDRFVEFHAYNSHGSRRAGIVSEKSKITTPPRSRRHDWIGLFNHYNLGTEREPRTPTFCSHCDNVIRGRSASFLTSGNLCSDSAGRGRNGTAGVSASVDNRCEPTVARWRLCSMRKHSHISPARQYRICAQNVHMLIDPDARELR